jgi:hypothetical protein
VGGVVLLMTIAWLIFYRRSEKKKRESREAMIAEQRQRETFQPDPLTRARVLLSSGDQLAFLKEMENAIWKETAEKLSIRRALLNQPRVIAELKAKGANDTAHLFSELVNCCEASLFMPGVQTENLQDILEKSQILFTRLNALDQRNQS